MLLRKIFAALFGLGALFSMVQAFTHDPGLGFFLTAMVQAGIACWIYWPARPAAQVQRQKTEEMQRKSWDELQLRIRSIQAGEPQNVSPVSVRLKDGEAAIFVGPAILMEKQSKGFSGQRTSVSVKLTKSVTVGTSAMKGRQEKEWVPVTSGEIVVTDQRVVFAGELKSFEFARDKVTNAHNMGNGVLLLHVGSKTHAVMLHPGNDMVCEAALAA